MILRNIQAIESNFLVLEEEDEVALDFFPRKEFPEENLKSGLEKRIEQELLKKEYYLERIDKFKEWTETVLVNVESIMSTMNTEFPKEQDSLLGKKLNDESLSRTFNNHHKISKKHFRVESSNFENSIEEGGFSRQKMDVKKRYSEMLTYEKDPQNAFQVWLI